MLIGICSDSHDHIENTKKAVHYFKEKEVERVVHAGDYCSPFIVPLFDGLNLHGVFGNNDGDKYLLMRKFDEIGAVLHGDFLTFEVDNLAIAVYHGTHKEITRSLELSGSFDLVISGHTHEPRMDTIEHTLSVNPGSVNGFDQDTMVALFNTETKKVEFTEL